MIEIPKEIAEKFIGIPGIGGYWEEFGAVIGDNAEFVLVYKENDPKTYLCHISEFEQNGIFIKLKQ